LFSRSLHLDHARMLLSELLPVFGARAGERAGEGARMYSTKESSNESSKQTRWLVAVRV
jgi:hypothetical protein